MYSLEATTGNRELYYLVLEDEEQSRNQDLFGGNYYEGGSYGSWGEWIVRM